MPTRCGTSKPWATPDRPGALARPGPFAWCGTTAIGIVVFGTRMATGAEGSGPDLALWAWMLGAAGCLRTLTLLLEVRGERLPGARMVCGLVGLMAWSQMLWLFGRDLAPTSGSVPCGLALYTGVAVLELRSIYEAARHVGSDYP